MPETHQDLRVRVCCNCWRNGDQKDIFRAGQPEADNTTPSASVLAPPVQPTTLAELALPAVYQQAAKGEQFLLYDSGTDNVHRFLIFGTQHNLGMLQRSKIWLANGTSPLCQVYVVHGLRGGDDPMKTGHLLPSLFVLSPNKT
ncbi:GfV-C17-ORF1 [Oopsacas minuta]|uniref:GfV-C17-ORF1 n=1 Tax=Oopsacas minuta TaxID=111878 RepID=A0AAV7JHA7_9METZ|nr:GfV-C17-ORF1 [Oopsacas minuta]